MIVGDIGELGEDGEGTDEERHLGRLELTQTAVERGFRRAVAMLADRLLAYLLDQVEIALTALQAVRVLAILFLDDRPEQASQKANDLPTCLSLLIVRRCRFHAFVRLTRGLLSRKQPTAAQEKCEGQNRGTACPIEPQDLRGVPPLSALFTPTRLQQAKPTIGL